MRQFLLLCIISLLLTIPAFAQDNSCSTVIEDVVSAVGTFCDNLERNQACYGNEGIVALNFDRNPLDNFEQQGDLTNLGNLATLTTSPFDEVNQTWGLALLQVTGNLPDTVPGQAVTFVVYGDTEIINDIPPSDSDSTTLLATSTGNLNVRSGAGTNFGILGTLATGDEITVYGRNEAGDWLQFSLDDQTAWIYTSLVSVEGDVMSLPVVQNDSAPAQSPFQAFRFQSGIGEYGCEDVPRDGLLIQAPSNTTVNFLVNGIEVQVGSTALLNQLAEQVQVSTFEGTVAVTVGGETQLIDPGFTTIVDENTPPTEAEPYDYDAVRGAPIELLPEPVTIPITVPGDADWIDSGLEFSAGDVVTLTVTGEVNPCVQNPDCVPMGPAGMTDIGPAGTADPSIIYPAPDAAIAAVIAQVGDNPPFAVNGGGTFTLEHEGTLRFRINDEPLDNNEGTFIVTIETQVTE